MADLQTLLAMFLKDLYSGTIGATSGVNVGLLDGSASAPSLAFTAETTIGLARLSSGVVDLVGGSLRLRNSGATLFFDTSGTALVADGAANILALKNAANAQTFRIYGTTTGPKYLSLSHDGTNGVIDTAASSGVISIAPTNATSITTGKPMTVLSATSIPAGGTAGAGVMVSSTANFGIFFGSNTPSLSAAQGSLYLRSDGSSGSTRAYINTNGSTGWTAITTAA